jgi:uncharacterized membrane protein YbaN (DUF454 family)
VANYRHRGLTSRLLWLTVGFAAMFLALLGVLLPLVPTTPFVLLAAFAFMRSSQRLHDWLINHAVFGALIRDWRQHRAIGKPAKVTASLAMLAVFIVSVVLQVPGFVLLLQALVLGACMWFVVSRPLPPDRPPVR